MTVLNDNEIRALCDADVGGDMVYPFEPAQVRHHTRDMQEPARPWDSGVNGALERVISYGTSSFGYDARLADEFMVPRAGMLDPKHPDICRWESYKSDSNTLIIPPHGFVLARTVERFKMPDDVIAICVGKSTYARNGLIVNVTPLEPGWEGHVTLELSNTTDLPSVVYVGEGICQFVFLTGNPPSTSYADRNGKYQNQTGVTLARV